MILLSRPPPPTVGVCRGSLPARGQPLFEFGEPYLETDEVLGEFTGRAELHQFLYARPVPLSLGLRYLLRALGGYGVKIVHSSSPFKFYSPLLPLLRESVGRA